MNKQDSNDKHSIQDASKHTSKKADKQDSKQQAKGKQAR